MVSLLKILPRTVVFFVCGIVCNLDHSISYVCHLSHPSMLVLMVVIDSYSISYLERILMDATNVLLGFRSRNTVVLYVSYLQQDDAPLLIHNIYAVLVSSC